MVAFALVGAGAALFVPMPAWARWTSVFGLLATAGGLALVGLLHRRVGHRFPKALGAFVAGAAAPRGVLVRAGSILLATWVVRWFGVLFILHAVGVHLGLGGALLYMVVTGLANTAPILPGNVGVYQGAAVGSLAMLGHHGAPAVAASLLTPVVGSCATAAAAAIGLAFYGRGFLALPRAALARSSFGLS
jgi:uncharacterized membrane protein YbhN (UPF0104 family)